MDEAVEAWFASSHPDGQRAHCRQFDVKLPTFQNRIATRLKAASTPIKSGAALQKEQNVAAAAIRKERGFEPKTSEPQTMPLIKVPELLKDIEDQSNGYLSFIVRNARQSPELDAWIANYQQQVQSLFRIVL